METKETKLKQFKQIPFCYFPTTITLIDDDPAFTQMMQDTLSKRHLCYIFNEPKAALNWLEKQEEPNLSKKLTSELENESRFYETSENLAFDLQQIHRIVYQKERFKLPSVAVIDHAMPEMTGLDLCKCLTRKSLRKIMLTGNADTNLAVDAFNQGLIDKFLLKSAKRDRIGQLRDAIIEQEMAFIECLFQPLRKLFKTVQAVIDQPEFVHLFNQIIHEYNIVEFYLLDKWGSYLLLDADGKRFILAVRDQAECDSYYEMAAFLTDEPTDESILTQMKEYKLFPFFYNQEKSDQPIGELVDCLYPANPVGECYYSFIQEDQVAVILGDSQIVSLNDYKELEG